MDRGGQQPGGHRRSEEPRPRQLAVSPTCPHPGMELARASAWPSSAQGRPQRVQTAPSLREGGPRASLRLTCPQGAPHFQGLHPSPMEPVISRVGKCSASVTLEQGLACPPGARGSRLLGPPKVNGRAGPGLLPSLATAHPCSGQLLLILSAGCEVPLAKQVMHGLGMGGAPWTQREGNLSSHVEPSYDSCDEGHAVHSMAQRDPDRALVTQPQSWSVRPAQRGAQA